LFIQPQSSVARFQREIFSRPAMEGYRSQFLKLAEPLKEEIALVKLIHQGEVFLQSGELSMFFKQAQTDGMQRAHIHFVHIGRIALRQQAAGNTGNKLVGRFFSKRGHQQLFR